MRNIPLYEQFLLLLGGMFLYGLRSVVGKWMVDHTIKLLKSLIIKTEKDMALYLYHRNRAMRKRNK